MVRAAIILMLLAITARAEWYTATLPDGSVVSVPVRTDPALNAAVGGVVTSAVMPQLLLEQPQNVATIIESARTNLVTLSTQSTTAAAQSNQIERIRRALLLITDALKDQP